MTNEEKKSAFLKKAQANKENFELHKQLIEESIKPLSYHIGKESVKHFYETGSVSGGFLLALMEYAENYAEAKVKNLAKHNVIKSVCFCAQHTEYIDANGIRRCDWCGEPIKQTVL